VDQVLAAEIEPTRAEKKRKEILDAAAAVISKRGYAQTMLGEIAKQARTQSGSLYYHFASRDDLIEEVMREGVKMTFAHSQATVAALPRSATPGQRLAAAIRAHLCLMLVESNYARATARLIGQVPDAMWQRVNSENVKYGRFIDRLIKAAMKSGEIDPAIDPSAYRLLIIGSVNWAPEWYRPNGRLSTDQVADLYLRMVMDGVKGPKKSKSSRTK
jgi:TetR/AcrR family transcriptional regulator, cholesterol catabolism regulator